MGGGNRQCCVVLAHAGGGGDSKCWCEEGADVGGKGDGGNDEDERMASRIDGRRLDSGNKDRGMWLKRWCSLTDEHDAICGAGPTPGELRFVNIIMSVIKRYTTS